jgi:hypothetical protein
MIFRKSPPSPLIDIDVVKAAITARTNDIHEMTSFRNLKEDSRKTVCIYI